MNKYTYIKISNDKIKTVVNEIKKNLFVKKEAVLVLQDRDNFQLVLKSEFQNKPSIIGNSKLILCIGIEDFAKKGNIRSSILRPILTERIVRYWIK